MSVIDLAITAQLVLISLGIYGTAVGSWLVGVWFWDRRSR